MTDQYVVLGATGGPGLGVFLKLALEGHRVVGIARDAGRTGQLRSVLEGRKLGTARLIEVDLQRDDCAHVLEREVDLIGTSHLISASRAPFLNKAVSVMPSLKRIVALGSTRIFTRFADQRMDDMKRMETYLGNQPVPFTILHPTMIYGGTGYNNVERIRRFLGYLPLIPLPAGGEVLIQPVHNDDVVRCVMAALVNTGTQGKSLVLAGPKALSYADFVRNIASDMGTKAVCISVPLPALRTLAFLTRCLPFLPSIEFHELRRLLENKDFSTDDMRKLLGVVPMSFEEGLKNYYELDEALEHMESL